MDILIVNLDRNGNFSSAFFNLEQVTDLAWINDAIEAASVVMNQVDYERWIVFINFPVKSGYTNITREVSGDSDLILSDILAYWIELFGTEPSLVVQSFFV